MDLIRSFEMSFTYGLNVTISQKRATCADNRYILYLNSSISYINLVSNIHTSTRKIAMRYLVMCLLIYLHIKNFCDPPNIQFTIFSSFRLASKILKIRILSKSILSLFFFGIQIQSLLQGKVGMLNVLNNNVFRSIFGLNEEDLTREQKQLHIEWLHNLHPSPNTMIFK